MVDRCRMDSPVVLRKLFKLHCVVTNRGQAITARLPGQQNLTGLNVLLKNRGSTGRLWTCWKNRTKIKAC